VHQDLDHEAGTAGIEALARPRVLRWCATVGLAWRALAYPPALLQALHEGHARIPAAATAPLLLILVGNLGLLANVLWRGSSRLLESKTFCALDIAVAVSLNLWSGTLATSRSILVPYQDVFSVYAWDTVALWTALRGPEFGLILCAAVALPMQLGMAIINGYTLRTLAWGTVLERGLWILAHFLVATVVVLVAREVAWATAKAALRAGREAERATTLRNLHDTVLQTLEGIVMQASHAESSAADRLRAVTAAASQQATALRTALQKDAEAPTTDLVSCLRAVVEECAGAGLSIELVLSQLDGLEPPPPARDALVGALREACNNVAKHAHVSRAVIRAIPFDGGVQVTVRDHGCGFNRVDHDHGFGLENSIIHRLQDVGGHADVSSSPGRGTKVTLWAPMS
jgi:signal transduction histidine kinase